MNNYVCDNYKVVKKENLAKNCFSLTIKAENAVKITSSGQFAQIKIKDYFLRRPISICECNKDTGEIRFVFAIKGNGTEILAQTNIGEYLDVILPLGKGFSLNENYSKVVLVGGGIGVPPLIEVSKFYKEKSTAIIGFQNSQAVILEDDLKNNNVETIVCTDDGSYGKKGFTTTALGEYLKNNKVDFIYSCGPNLMLKGVVDIAKKYNVNCEVSLEEHMGCGVGACLVCACRAVKNGEEYYAHVCKDGPVFNSNNVIL